MFSVCKHGRINWSNPLINRLNKVNGLNQVQEIETNWVQSSGIFGILELSRLKLLVPAMVYYNMKPRLQMDCLH